MKRTSEMNYVENALLRLKGESIPHYHGRIMGTIFIHMNKLNYFPLPHIHVVETMAREVYILKGYEKAVIDSGLKSFLKPNYIAKNGHLRYAKNYLSQECKLTFGYVLNEKSINGFWQFLTNEQCRQVETQKKAELNTRREGVNTEIENMIIAGGLNKNTHPLVGEFTYVLLSNKNKREQK